MRSRYSGDCPVFQFWLALTVVWDFGHRATFPTVEISYLTFVHRITTCVLDIKLIRFCVVVHWSLATSANVSVIGALPRLSRWLCRVEFSITTCWNLRHHSNTLWCSVFGGQPWIPQLCVLFLIYWLSRSFSLNLSLLLFAWLTRLLFNSSCSWDSGFGFAFDFTHCHLID